MGLDGVEIFTNASGSYHELRKLRTAYTLIEGASMKVRAASRKGNPRDVNFQKIPKLLS